jgi:O-phospho-L-seryl-tRNASec:L-selenocysteinyl-tRNA synthase
MDDRNFKLAEQLVNPTYIRLAQNSINKREKIVRELLSQRQLPNEPLDDLTIRYLLDCIALMDSNNFEGKIGVGERESRIFSRLVEERHFYMGHGIGTRFATQEEVEMLQRINQRQQEAAFCCNLPDI